MLFAFLRGLGLTASARFCLPPKERDTRENLVCALVYNEAAKTKSHLQTGETTGFKMTIHKLTLASCLLLLFAVAATAQDFKIEPGRRVGKIELGASRQMVHQTLGKPSATYRAPGKQVGEVWMASTGNDVRIVYKGGRVVQIKVTSSSFVTPEGLTTNSSLADVQKHHSNLVKISRFVHGSGGGLIDYYDDVRRGIAFEFTSVDSDTPNFKPYAIVVHRPGQRVTPENDEEQIIYER